MSAETITFVNYKGGVTKTSTTVGIGAALSRHGKKVLLVDMDPQNNISFCLGFGYEDWRPKKLTTGLSDVLGNKTSDLASIIYQARTDLWVAPAGANLAAHRYVMQSKARREGLLERSLRPLLESFDYVLIDTPPDEGILSTNAIFAAQFMIIPTMLDGLAQSGMSRVEQTMLDLNDDYPENATTLLGIVVNVKHGSERAANMSELDHLWNAYPDLVFTTSIASERQIRHALKAGKTVYDWEEEKGHKCRAMGAFEVLSAEIEKWITKSREAAS